MDDLDRLAFRLVRKAREGFPQLLTHGFSLSDLEERLLPFGEVRREMADSGAVAWETSVLRLLSGEREYLVAEPKLQAACKQALSHPSPSVSLVRSWATSTLSLGTGAARIGVNPAAPASTTTSESTQRGCAHCGGRLPDGRVVTFCPYCGLDLTKRQCPACSTELEMRWQFCVTCGRGADLPDAVPTELANSS
jgi:hypothetical protein